MKYTSIHETKIMLNSLLFDNFINNIKIGFFILIVNIIFYLILFFFFLFFFFFFNLTKFKNLNDIKKNNTNSFFYLSFILALLSFSGMPPLLGFFSKFSIVIFFWINNSHLYILLFFILNIFLIFFYIQNIKFLIKKNKNNNNLTLNFFEFKIFSNFYYLVFFFFLNFFSFFFLEIFFVYIENLIIF